MNKEAIGFCMINEQSNPVKPKIIGEEFGRPIIETILMETEVINRNTRYYGTNNIRSEVEGKRTNELLNARSLPGEAGHPLTNDMARQVTIDPKCISHLILDMWMKGNVVYGKIIGTPNEYGELFSSLIREGTRTAFSLRAIGIIKKTPKGLLVDKAKMTTFDWVFYPSFENAYQTVGESAGYTLNESGIAIPDNGNKIIIESANYDGCKPISLSKQKAKDVFDYIKEESSTIKGIQNMLEIEPSSLAISNDRRMISFDEVGTSNKWHFYVESKVTDDLISHFGKL